MDLNRRTLIEASLATLIAGAILPACALTQEGPTPMTTPPKGKAGEFDFLDGEWTIKHRRLPQGAITWDEFEGEATCWTILGGVGSVEELRIPARDFSGMGLRLLNAETKIWYDLWVNAKGGVLTGPGTPGGFVNGAGIFDGEEMDGDKPIIARGVWDEITPTSCRWRQLISYDAGKSWSETWIMHWTRRAPR